MSRKDNSILYDRACREGRTKRNQGNVPGTEDTNRDPATCSAVALGGTSDYMYHVGPIM